MTFRLKIAAAALMLVALPVAADAQGFVGGARSGFDDGDRVAGPIGGIVGGAIGAGVGTVRGAIGLDARPDPVVLAPAGDAYTPRYRRHYRRHVRHSRRYH